MVEVRLYGKLRRYGEDRRPNGISRRLLKAPTTVGSLLQQMGVPREDIAHIFLNGRLLYSISPMALWLRYPEPEGRVPPKGDVWEAVVQEGDRVALFGRDMALLVV
jgi:hypothetical protein